MAEIAETTVIDYAIRIHCDVMKIGGEFLPRPNSLMFNKNQKVLMNEIDKIFWDMKYGKNKTMQKIRDYWWHEKFPARDCYEHRKLSNGITLMNVGGIFIVVSAGCMASLVALWCENTFYERKALDDIKNARIQAITGNHEAPPFKKDHKAKCAIQ